MGKSAASNHSEVSPGTKYSSNDLGPIILKLLGVPDENCRSAVIRLKVNAPVLIEAEYFASMGDNAECLETQIRRYRLIEDPDRLVRRCVNCGREEPTHWVSHPDSGYEECCKECARIAVTTGGKAWRMENAGHESAHQTTNDTIP